MAKKDTKFAPTVDTLKPYLERAMSDSEFRDDLKEALSAAQQALRPAREEAARVTALKSATRLATDAKVQENLRKALEDFGKAAETLKGKKKKSHKAPQDDAARRSRRGGALQPLDRAEHAAVAAGQDRG